jgi:hypothetical protein
MGQPSAFHPRSSVFIRGSIVCRSTFCGLCYLVRRDDQRAAEITMFGFGKKPKPDSPADPGPRVSPKLCTEKFTGKYPHVGLYDCRARKVWVAKPLSGQAIRTSHARLITGADNATSTVWKDRFLCFWFYTPRTGEGFIHNYPIDWEEAHLLVASTPHGTTTGSDRSLRSWKTRRPITSSASTGTASGSFSFSWMRKSGTPSASTSTPRTPPTPCFTQSGGSPGERH